MTIIPSPAEMRAQLTAQAEHVQHALAQLEPVASRPDLTTKERAAINNALRVTYAQAELIEKAFRELDEAEAFTVEADKVRLLMQEKGVDTIGDLFDTEN